MVMQLLDLFSGIGGFSLGLERSGAFETTAFCEIDPYCRAVLKKHWPGVPCYDDIRTLSAATLRRDGIAVDATCGGFPCQDLSLAGKRAGIEASRSGLWTEYARLIGELRPGIVIVENVPGILSLGLGRVLGDLAALGYDAIWDCIPASAIGAPHRRDRFWLIAYAGSEQHQGDSVALWRAAPEEFPIAYPANIGKGQPAIGRGGVAPADAYGHQQHGRRCALQVGWQCSPCEAADDGRAIGAEWCIEPALGRVAHGVPKRVDRLRALGNAVVPQIPELIGRAILKALNREAA